MSTVIPPISLQGFRHAQQESFAARGFPSRKEEKWKYTDLSLAAKQWATFGNPIKKNPDCFVAATKFSVIDLVFVDGFLSSELSNVGTVPKEIMLGSTFQLSEVNKQLLDILTIAHDSMRHAMSCFNASRMTEGLCVVIPDDIQFTTPIRCTFIQTQEQVQISPRNIILLGKNSSATVIEEYIGLSDVYLTNAVTQLIMDRDATIDYFKIQKEANQASHFSSLFVQQKQSSRVNCFNFSSGSQLAREEIYVDAAEQGAACHLHGLYYLSETQQQSDHYLQVNHSASHTTSSMNYTGILNHKSRAVFNGKVHVHPQVKQIQAHQENHNLLLSASAEINTKPELEIYADDVKCTHGATVGQLDAEALFYLQARGVAKEEALAMLTEAFASDFFSVIPQSDIKKYMQQQVSHHVA